MIVFSTHGGTTRKVAERIAARMGEQQVVDLQRSKERNLALIGRHLILLCPAYGDEEHEHQFEAFLHEQDWSAAAGMRYAFCELGIYTGYEEFGHGLLPMVCELLEKHGLTALAPSLSLDSVPITDWTAVDAWADLLCSRLEGSDARP